MAVYLGENEVILRNGISTTDADATAADILAGKTAYVDDKKLIGTISSKSAATYTPSTTNQTITSGQYLSGSQTISGDADLTAANIKSGVSIFGVTGTYEGGGGTPTAVTKKDVNFYDYYGALVAGYTIAEAQALSALPTAPTHSNLTFQEWNYTLAQVSATTSALDVGATYITADGKTHLHITLTAVSGLAPTLYLNKSDDSTLTVDWGDSSSNTFTNTGKFNTGAHTYSAAGNYVIKLWISSGSGTYTFGNGSATTTAVGGDTDVYRQALTSVFVGVNVTSIGDYAFYNCYSLTSITISSGITSIGVGTFYNCYSLTSITVPSGITSIRDYAFYGCRVLASIAIPSGITSIGAGAFYGFYSLTSITIPSGVTSIGTSALYGFYSCKSYTTQPTTPPTLANVSAFTGIVSICKIRVPSASLSAYQAATNWSTYANYMEGY